MAVRPGDLLPKQAETPAPEAGQHDGMKFTAARGLDETVAARVARPAADWAADKISRAERGAAPPAHVWITAADERVRGTHRAADGQTIPGNLRFEVPLPGPNREWGEDPGVGAGVELARAPRDRALSAANYYGCRCVSVESPQEIARRVEASPATVQGATARARVSVQFHRITESEHPSSPDGGGGWWSGAAASAAREIRASLAG